MAFSTKKGEGRCHAWIMAHVGYDGDWCLIWPFSMVNGYGMFAHLGEQLYAHRYMCELVNGPAPSPDHDAGHTCGNGHKGCIHPKHLAWRTKSENQADRAAQGTRNVWSSRGLLQPEDVAEIRRLRGAFTQKELAVRFNTSRANVSLIQNGKAWMTRRKGYIKYGDRFRARVTVNRKVIWLGVYDTEEEAHAAYLAENAKVRETLRAQLD